MHLRQIHCILHYFGSLLHLIVQLIKLKNVMPLASHCKKFLEQVIEAQAFPKDDARYTELMIALESGWIPIIKLPDQKWPKAFFRLQLMMPRSRCHLSHNAPQNKN